MSVDLLRTVRLLHRVLGFLTQETPEHLADIAEGRRRLVSVDARNPAPVVAPAQTSPVVPEPVVPEQVVPEQVVPEPADPSSRPRKAGPDKVSTRRPVDEVAEADYVRLADELRAQKSEAAGAAFLGSARWGNRRLRKADLIKLGAQMGLTLTNSSTAPEMTRKLVERAIGARKKYAGLSRW